MLLTTDFQSDFLTKYENSVIIYSPSTHKTPSNKALVQLYKTEVKPLESHGFLLPFWDL